MSILDYMKSIFGHEARLVAERGATTVHSWVSAAGEWIVCTIGMSDRPQVVPAGLSCPSKEPRTELMAFCRVCDTKVVADMLLDLAEYPFKENTHLFWWQVLPLGRRLVPGSRIEGVLLSMPPLPVDQVTFKLDERRIDIVWVVPILGDELAVAQRQGIDALEERLERENVDIADINRAGVSLSSEH